MRRTTETGRLEPALLEVVGYAVTSARTLLDETPTYGPLRLLEVAKRILDAMDEEGVGPVALRDLRTRIDTAAAALLEGEAAFRARLDALVEEALRLG